jgi:hypothetical protein
MNRYDSLLAPILAVSMESRRHSASVGATLTNVSIVTINIYVEKNLSSSHVWRASCD